MASEFTAAIVAGRTPPGPGPITTMDEYFNYWAAAGAFLALAADPATAPADRISARDTAYQLISATKQVCHNPPLHAAITDYVLALLEERGRAAGYIK